MPQFNESNGRIVRIGLQSAPHPPYSPDLTPSDYWMFADLKKMIQRKRFGLNAKVIAETEAYFEGKDKSFNKHGMEKLEKRWNDRIGNYD